LFLRGSALKAFVEDVWRPAEPAALEASFSEGPHAPAPLLADLRRDPAKTRVTACSAWVRLLNVPLDRVASRVDAVTGLNAFLSQSAGGPILYI
jgi:hypothetical protein